MKTFATRIPLHKPYMPHQRRICHFSEWYMWYMRWLLWVICSLNIFIYIYIIFIYIYIPMCVLDYRWTYAIGIIVIPTKTTGESEQKPFLCLVHHCISDVNIHVQHTLNYHICRNPHFPNSASDMIYAMLFLVRATWAFDTTLPYGGAS